jgi:hypothetical protein
MSWCKTGEPTGQQADLLIVPGLTGCVHVRDPRLMSECRRLEAPPPPTPEELAEWRALIERFEDGDESDLVPWEEIAAELNL